MIQQTLEQHCAALAERCTELRAECERLRSAARPRAVEKYYSPAELAVLLAFSEAWVRRHVSSGAFPGAVALDRDLRIPASSVNAFLDSRRYDLPEGIAARSLGELRRKAGRFTKEAAA